MRILVVEGVTGLGDKIDARLFPEGFGMLRTMVNEFGKAGFEVIVPLKKELKPLSDWLDAEVTYTRDGIDEALHHKPDAALVIAPEKGGELELITSRLRRKGIPVLGAQEKAIRTSADKWLTYLTLNGKVPQPRTWRQPPRVKGQILAKPIDGVGCEGIGFLPTNSKTKGMIFQEFCEGEHASCCLLVGKNGGRVLSVNRQQIAVQGGWFEYLGSEVPFEHELAKGCAEVALCAANAMKLRGYCGVDLVVGDIPYFIELNPRLTTSFIALSKVAEFNLGELLVDALIKEVFPQRLTIRGHSILRILKVNRDARPDSGKLRELREIPEVVAPPLLLGDYRGERSSILITGTGSSADRAKRKLIDAADEASALLGVDFSAFAWS